MKSEKKVKEGFNPALFLGQAMNKMRYQK